jgi:hypothetical protein
VTCWCGARMVEAINFRAELSWDNEEQNNKEQIFCFMIEL